MATPKYMYVCDSGGYPYRSIDSGATWSSTGDPGTGSWRQIRCSDDGKHVLLIRQNANYWVSNDYGENWTEVSVSRDWRDCAVSKTGQMMAVVSFDGNNCQLSQDYGQTWADTSGQTSLTGIDFGEYGRDLLTCKYGEDLEISDDKGATWTDEDGGTNRNWRSCAMSGDNSFRMGAYDSGAVRYATSGSSTFSSYGSITWAGECCVSNNSSTAINISDSRLHYTNDGGSTWSSTAADSWTGVEISEDGNYVLGVKSDSASYVQLSSDGGDTWDDLTGSSSTLTYTCCSMSKHESTPESLLLDLVAYYEFDGDVTDIHNGNDGTTNGVTSTSTALIGSAYEFDGSNDDIDMGDISAFDLYDTSFTINLWLANASTPGFGTVDRILAKEGADSYRGWGLYHSGWDNSTNAIAFGNAEGWYQTADNVVPTGTTYSMITITYDNSGSGSTLKCYVDGSSTALTLYFTLEWPVTRNTVNLHFGSNNSAGNYYDGNIDEAGIWRRVLTSTEITNLYNSGDGFAYPFTPAAGGGWTGTIIDVTDPSEVVGIVVANITSINEVT